MLDNLTKDTFAENLNTRFRLTLQPEKTLELELVEVSESEIMRAQGVENFMLLFRGPADTYLPQAIYPLDHDALGRQEIFIVPVNRDEQGYYYQAVFNRVKG